MARLSDLIESFIKDMIRENEKRTIEIKRNELANEFNCAPSQINYVLSTRFTVERGYVIESRRGGGGYIKIIKLNVGEKEYIYNIVNNIGDSISVNQAASIVSFLKDQGIIKEREKKIMMAVLNNRVLDINNDIKNSVRASLLKSMLASLLR